MASIKSAKGHYKFARRTGLAANLARAGTVKGKRRGTLTNKTKIRSTIKGVTGFKPDWF